MKPNHTSNIIFMHSGCITADSLKAYVAGKLDIKDKAAVDFHLRNCPFCTDALEGLSSLSDPGIIEASLTSLEKRIKQRVLKENNVVTITGRTNKRSMLLYGSVAAGLLIIIGLFSLVYFYNKFNNNKLQENISLLNSPKPSNFIDSSQTKKESSITRSEPGKASDAQLKKVKQQSVSPGPATTGVGSMPAVAINSQEEEINSQPEQIITKDSKAKSDSTVVTGITSEVRGLKVTTEKSFVSNVAAGESRDLSEAAYSSKSNSFRANKLSSPKNDEDKLPETTMPLFKGKGIAEFEKYVEDHLRYPKKAIEDRIEATIYISFTVDSTGNVVNVISSIPASVLLEKEAIRVVRSSPKWKPAYQNGSPVNVKLSVPVYFRIKPTIEQK